MRVLSSGVVGADDAAAIPNNPPVVEFTYYIKEGGVVTQRTLQKTLNQSLIAGHPVEIADGIYTVFGAGALTAGNQLDFAVDGDPDAAGLLPALGINGMMSGFEAGSMAVAQRLLQDPSQLGVAHTRSAGDNANVTTFSGLRARALFGTGQTFDESFQSMVFDIGVQVSQNKRFQENQAIVEKSLQNRRDAQNGVNIDEEVGNLILEQQAYAAAARVITSAKENMETLLNILR
jgi:flagellar hook-associated protein 1 FlgK